MRDLKKIWRTSFEKELVLQTTLHFSFSFQGNKSFQKNHYFSSHFKYDRFEKKNGVVVFHQILFYQELTHNENFSRWNYYFYLLYLKYERFEKNSDALLCFQLHFSLHFKYEIFEKKNDAVKWNKKNSHYFWWLLLLSDTSPNDNVGRGFQTFRVRSSIIYRYSRNLVHPSRRKNNHIPVSDRQVRGYRRHGQELLPFPWHQVLDRLWISLTIPFMLRSPLADRC